MKEILLEWHNKSAMREEDIVTPEMSIENQAAYLSKKYTTIKRTIDIKTYDSDQNVIVTPTELDLICFKDVVCKYRPHLHMGDYYLSVTIIDSVPNYHFYSIRELTDDREYIANSQHPHLNNGKPCLGSFQGDLATNFRNGNFIQFFSVMRAYLQAYNGRSTYSRGTAYKKLKVTCHLHSYDEIYQMFKPEDEGSDLDVVYIARDPMRWSWPKDMAAFHSIEISGQDNMLLNLYAAKSKYPYVGSIHNFMTHSGDNSQKIRGYVAAAMVIGELNIWQAFEFVRIFLLSIQAQYSGNVTPEQMAKLEKMANQIYESRNGRYEVNNRYISNLDLEHKTLAIELWSPLEPYYRNRYSNTRNGEINFVSNLTYVGNKLTNFMILLRKRSPHLGKSNTYMMNKNEEVDVIALEKKFNKVKKFAYNVALIQVEKERRRFINELNRPEISNIIGADGQGTLFSENL